MDILFVVPGGPERRRRSRAHTDAGRDPRPATVPAARLVCGGEARDAKRDPRYEKADVPRSQDENHDANLPVIIFASDVVRMPHLRALPMR